MTPIFGQVLDSPQMHVLLVGVGNYPYLRGGEFYTSDATSLMEEMGQLTSPEQSVMSLYQTIMDFNTRDAWVTPLGTVRVLLSPSRQVPAEMNGCPRATIENIRSAYASWRADCGRNKKNVAFFYFCGHGLQKGDQFLLAEDFGRNRNYPWQDAFTFDATRRAFHGCGARTQLFFADACRLVPPKLLEDDLSVGPLESPKYVTRECRYDLTIKAAAHNEYAFGRPGKPSFFCRALTDALTEAAAENKDDEWMVTSGAIAKNIAELLDSLMEETDQSQRCIAVIGRSTNLVRLLKPPTVQFAVRCFPGAAHLCADLSSTNLDTGDCKKRPFPEEGPWEIPVPAGIYEVEASFENGRYKSCKKKRPVLPPSARVKLICK